MEPSSVKCAKDFRDAILAYYFEELNLSEASRIYSVTKYRLKQAIKKLNTINEQRKESNQSPLIENCDRRQISRFAARYARSKKASVSSSSPYEIKFAIKALLTGDMKEDELVQEYGFDKISHWPTIKQILSRFKVNSLVKARRLYKQKKLSFEEINDAVDQSEFNWHGNYTSVLSDEEAMLVAEVKFHQLIINLTSTELEDFLNSFEHITRIMTPKSCEEYIFRIFHDLEEKTNPTTSFLTRELTSNFPQVCSVLHPNCISKNKVARFFKELVSLSTEKNLLNLNSSKDTEETDSMDCCILEEEEEEEESMLFDENEKWETALEIANRELELEECFLRIIENVNQSSDPIEIALQRNQLNDLKLASQYLNPLVDLQKEEKEPFVTFLRAHEAINSIQRGNSTYQGDGIDSFIKKF